jgi:O-antigen ligase
LAVSFCRPITATSVLLVPLSLYAAAMVVMVQNRGAVLGLVASLVALFLSARSRGRWFLLSLIPTVAAAAWVLRAGLAGRFREIYANGQFLDTAAHRLEIWRGSLEIVRRHWLFGVGPGNFNDFLPRYTGGRVDGYAHNSVVEILGETGVIGLALYVGVFAAAGWMLARTVRSSAGWERPVSIGLLGALAAHVVAGMFQSNPSLLWIYVLLGSAAGVSLRSSHRTA